MATEAQLGVPLFDNGPCNTLEDMRQKMSVFHAAVGNPVIPIDNTVTTVEPIYVDEGGDIVDGDGNVVAPAAASLTFKTIVVSGQSDVVADASDDTLTLVAGANVTITTNAGTDTITIDAGSTADLLIFKALVNDGTGVISTDATLAFDGTAAIYGTAPASGTAANIHARAFWDNEPILVFYDGTTYSAVKVSPNNKGTAKVNDGGGTQAATFAFDNGSAIHGLVPTSGTAANPDTLWFNDNEPIEVELKANGEWHVRKMFGACVILGDATASFTDAAATFDIDSITVIHGHYDGGTTTVANEFSWDGDDNARVMAIQEKDGTWTAVQVECPA
jgi:hypothetical protein